MIFITGSAIGTDDTIAELTQLLVAHSQRSRQETGCLTHAVHVDAENPLRLVIVETWSDEAAIRAHFALASSRAVVKQVRGLATEQDGIQIYKAEKIAI